MEQDIYNQFLEAYDELSEPLYRHCYFRVYTATRAEELVQDTFTKTWQYLESGKTVDNLKAFLYKVATNLIIDESRKAKQDSLDAILEINPALEPGYDGHKNMERDTLMGEVKSAINQMPEESRQLLVMRYIDDLDPKEIAEILGNTTVNNVSVKITRAAQQLRKILE